MGDVIARVFIDDGHCVSGHIVHILESALFVNFLLMGCQRMVWHAPGGEGLHHTHAALSLTLRFQILFSVLDSRHGGSTKT